MHLDELLTNIKKLPLSEKLHLFRLIAKDLESEKTTEKDGDQDSKHQEPNPEGRFDQKRTLEIQWLADHRAEYAGQYVALNGHTLLCHGKNGREVLQKAKEMGFPTPYIVRIDPRDDLPFGGW